MTDDMGNAEHRAPNSVTLKEYIESRIDSIREATNVATNALDKRLESMNEFRNALKDQAGQMVTRTECKTVHSRIDADLQMLREFKAVIDAKASWTATIIGIVFGVVGLVLSVLSLILKTQP